MTEQLDFFSVRLPSGRRSPQSPAQRAALAPADLDDDALVAAISKAAMADCLVLVAEAGRRKLAAAVPALAAVCRRLKGFGANQLLREQVAALEALAAVGGPEAMRAVTNTIIQAEVQGPSLKVAVAVAARLGAPLPAGTAVVLLRHDDPEVRADACRCACSGAEVSVILIDLLGDLHPAVRTAAACALGRMGRAEARPVLVRLLNEEPTAEVIDALALVADENAVVLMGRSARTRPDLADAVLAALDGCEHPQAERVARGIRESLMPPQVHGLPDRHRCSITLITD